MAPRAPTHTPGTAREPQRMEAFSDAVFAIAITLIVIDIKVPHPPGTPGSGYLATALIDLWPNYLAYLFSFTVIGIYWVNHHYTGKLYVRADHTLNLLNLLFLLAIAFLPFPTHVLADYIMDEANRTVAAAFYTGALVLPAAGWLLKWLYASHRGRILDPQLDGRFVRRLTMRYTTSLMIYLMAMAVTLIESWIGIAIATAVTLYYLLPPPPPVYIEDGRKRS
jgi:uncharacterized membrane protein